MQWAKQHLNQTPYGAVFLAHKLTHAHGRQGRTWELIVWTTMCHTHPQA